MIHYPRKRKPRPAPDLTPQEQRHLEESRAGHAKGNVNESPDGTTYLVTPRGSWVRTTPRRHEGRGK